MYSGGIYATTKYFRDFAVVINNILQFHIIDK